MVPFGTAVWKCPEFMLCLIPLIVTQRPPASVMFGGGLIVSVGPVLNVNVAVLFARFVLLIVSLGSIVSLNVWLPRVETQVNVEEAVVPASIETCKLV